MITLYDDARAAVIADLAGAMATRTESYAAGVGVSGELPAGQLPYLSVIPNGVTSRVRGVVQRVTVRVIAWHNTDVDAQRLAQLALALLSDRYLPLSGPDDAVDTESGRPFCAFTVRASMQGFLAP